MKAVFKHELALYFRSMTSYVFGTFLLLFTGVGALIYNINASVANFEYVLNFISIIFIVLVPILTMRIIAEEKRQKTDQLLYSLPITSLDVIAGKFAALMVIFAIPTAFIAFYPFLFSIFGDVYLPTSYGSLLAFYLLGLALISVGMFISSLTESQGMAAGICVAVMIFNYYCATLADYVSSTALGAVITIIIFLVVVGLIIRHMTKSDILGIGFAAVTVVLTIIVYVVNPEVMDNFLPNLMNKISLFERFLVFVNGVFDVTGLIYYISVIAFFLFLSVQSLEKRRYNG